MLVKYDELEDFLKKLDTLEKKQMTVFVKGVNQVNKSSQIVSTIVVQALDGETCYQLIYSEDLPMFQLIPDYLWEAIPDEELRKKARDSYTKSAEDHDKKVEGEYDKMVKILKDKGFTKIENAVLG